MDEHEKFNITLKKLLSNQALTTAKDIFDKFDKFACIKDDEWYKELKTKYTEK